MYISAIEKLNHMNKLLLLLLTCFLLEGNAQTKGDFNTLLKDHNIQFKAPTGFKSTPVIENPDLTYNYALLSVKDSIEVRYTIFPLASLMSDYETNLADPNVTVVNPNKYYESMYMANILSISQLGAGNMPTQNSLHSEVARIEFNADFAATSLFDCNSEYAKDYDHCLFILVHKENVADIYISILSDDQSKIEEKLLEVFKSINFK